MTNYQRAGTYRWRRKHICQALWRRLKIGLVPVLLFFLIYFRWRAPGGHGAIDTSWARNRWGSSSDWLWFRLSWTGHFKPRLSRLHKQWINNGKLWLVRTKLPERFLRLACRGRWPVFEIRISRGGLSFGGIGGCRRVVAARCSARWRYGSWLLWSLGCCSGSLCRIVSYGRLLVLEARKHACLWWWCGLCRRINRFRCWSCCWSVNANKAETILCSEIMAVFK